MQKYHIPLSPMVIYNVGWGCPVSDYYLLLSHNLLKNRPHIERMKYNKFCVAKVSVCIHVGSSHDYLPFPIVILVPIIRFGEVRRSLVWWLWRCNHIWLGFFSNYNVQQHLQACHLTWVGQIICAWVASWDKISGIWSEKNCACGGHETVHT